MLGKQWLNRYLRHAGGSMIDRCGDRQRKCDGLQRWPFHLIIGSLPVMLQVALLLLACGLCRYMASINTAVACTLIPLTGFGVLFYVGVVIAGASSYDCPFQTPGSALLRRSWAKSGPRLISIVFLVIDSLHTLGWTVRRRIFVVHLSIVYIRHHFLALLGRIRSGVHHIGFRLPRIGLNVRRRFPHPPLPTAQEGSRLRNSRKPIPWFAPNELATIQMKNANNVRCVSWVLRNITDPEALDAAIRLAGIIRWFEDGINVIPPYDLIVFTFHTCFGSDKVLYPGLRNRAYYSGRAILWIHTLAVCKSEGFARMFPLPTTKYMASASDHDLVQLLHVFQSIDPGLWIVNLLQIDERHTSPHSQRISNVLLHLSWAIETMHRFRSNSVKSHIQKVDASTPLDVIFNRLLMCCNLLVSPVGEEVLNIQDKSYGFACPCPPGYS